MRISEAARRKEMEAEARARTAPQVKGGDRDRVVRMSEKIGVRLKGNTSGKFVRSDSTGVIRSIAPADTLPDTRGMALRDAILMLESRGKTVVPDGAGMVTKQTVRGDSVFLKLL